MITTDYYPCMTPEEVCKLIDRIGKESIVSIVATSTIEEPRLVWYVFYQTNIEQQKQ